MTLRARLVGLKLETFHRWAREAPYEAVFVYHREPMERDEAIFDYARKLHEGGLVFLYQRKIDGGRWEKCARRTPITAHSVLDRVSAGVYVAPSSAALSSRENAA